MRYGLYLTAISGLLLMSGPAFADIMIDFEQGKLIGGTITYSAGQAVGSNIPVDILKVTNGSTTTFYDLIGDGPSSASETNGSALVNFNTATGLFTIVGGVCPTDLSCTTGAIVPLGTTLLNGTGSSAFIRTQTNQTLVLEEPDTKSRQLLEALGLPVGTSFALGTANFNNLHSISEQPGTFTVGSVDIANVAVPEPTSIVLLGTMLVGVTTIIRRRSKA